MCQAVKDCQWARGEEVRNSDRPFWGAMVVVQVGGVRASRPAGHSEQAEEQSHGSDASDWSDGSDRGQAPASAWLRRPSGGLPLQTTPFLPSSRASVFFVGAGPCARPIRLQFEV